MSRHITVRGAEENNLKRIDLNIPKGKLVVFTGVSGSGKSSLVFDTIAVEAMRQLRDTFPVYVRNRMPHYEAPRVESIDNLSTAIVVDQRALSANVRSTVGTLTDTAPLLRLLYSRCAAPAAPTSQAYSFNDPKGMCLRCGGLGYVAAFDLDRLLDRSKSLNEGAIRFPGHQVGACLWQVYARSGLYDPDKPLARYTEREWNDFLHGSGVTVTIRNTTGKVWGSSYQQTYEGFLDRLERLYLKRNIHGLSKTNQGNVEKFIITEPCPKCRGSRLNAAALQSKLMGYHIAELGAMEISDVIPLLLRLDDPIGKPTAEKIVARLKSVADMGLGYLNMDRASTTLSGGELQRLKLARHLGSNLIDLMYIFDEPSAGLHPHDVERLKRLLLRLRDRGNTVLVVEHQADIIGVADHVIELGPKAGREGGAVVFQGPVREWLGGDTLGARYLSGSTPLKKRTRPASAYLSVRDAALHNLKNISVDIPERCMVVVTGVAGAGKSSLIRGALLAQYPQAIYVSQAPLGTGSRSTPATYTGMMDKIRSLLAKENKVSPKWFSDGTLGACPACRGKGVTRVDMAFMDPVEVTCETCGGTRYHARALSYRYRGKNILEIMKMTIDEAARFFTDTPALYHKLTVLQEVGLGYLTLGQPTATLSGGECQRIKLAGHLKEKNHIYVMDEPTNGLHGYDVEVLLKLFDRLVDNGNTLVLAEHNLDVIRQADWVIDLGPDGGKAGGNIVFQGTPDSLAACNASYTGRYLQKSITANAKRRETGGGT